MEVNKILHLMSSIWKKNVNFGCKMRYNLDNFNNRILFSHLYSQLVIWKDATYYKKRCIFTFKKNFQSILFEPFIF